MMVFNPWKITREMFLSTAEVDDLLAHLARAVQSAVPTERNSAWLDRVIVETLLFSGLRNSEFCHLTLDAFKVGPDDATLEVRGTPREDRVVHIPRRLADLLQQYLAEIRPACCTAATDRSPATGPLVLNERGRAYERTALYRRVVRILNAAGLGARASVQLLRHTYGYLAYLRSGGNLLFVQRQLGHAHPMVTAIYAEFVDESYGELADAVGHSSASASQPPSKSQAARKPPPARKPRSKRSSPKPRS